jgi:hypothetical protein
VLKNRNVNQTKTLCVFFLINNVFQKGDLAARVGGKHDGNTAEFQSARDINSTPDTSESDVFRNVAVVGT